MKVGDLVKYIGVFHPQGKGPKRDLFGLILSIDHLTVNGGIRVKKFRVFYSTLSRQCSENYCDIEVVSESR